MNSIVIGVLTLVAMSSADTVLYPRGCIYVVGRCYKECPVGTHAYATGCGYMTPEPTCLEPNPVEGKSMICDYSACYCDPPTIKDTKINKCVLKKDCSKSDSPAVPTPTLLPPFEESKISPSEAPSGSENPLSTDAADGSESSDNVPELTTASP